MHAPIIKLWCSKTILIKDVSFVIVQFCRERYNYITLCEQFSRQDLRLLRDLAPIWDKAAETLHLSAAEIRIIEKNNTGDQSGRIREVVVKWLSNGSMLPEAGRYPVNWRGFFHLLLDAEQSDMAVSLKSALSANRSNIRKTF